MSLTESQIEEIADHMRSCGFDVSNLDNEQIANLAQCVLDALGIDFEN